MLAHPYFWEVEHKYHLLLNISFFSAPPATSAVVKTTFMEQELDCCPELRPLTSWLDEVRQRFPLVEVSQVQGYGQCYSHDVRSGKYGRWSDLLRFIGCGFKHANSTHWPLLEIFPELLITCLRVMARVQKRGRETEAGRKVSQWLAERPAHSKILQFFGYLIKVEKPR